MRHLVTLCLAAPLAACASLLAHQDSQSAALAGGIESEARTFFAGLAGATGPDCDFDHNTAAYDHLDSLAAGLQARIGAVRASPMLTTAGSKLAQAIADARESHRLASADATDANGTCMAPAAIALNANAIARAAAALAASQNLPSQNQPSQRPAGSSAMTTDIATMAGQIAAGMLETLSNSGSRVKTLAQNEANQLATAIANIGEMLASGQIDNEEAAALLRVQRDASESVLASLAEMSRVLASKAVTRGLANAASTASESLARILTDL